MLYLLPILFLILLLIYFHLTEYDLFHPVLQTISKEDFDNTANIVSLSIDPYRHNFDKVMEMLKNIYKMRKEGSDEQGRSNKFEKLILNIDHKKLDIDGEIFNLESDYGKEWKINGKKIKINVDAKEWKVDINERVSSIYCLIGSNKYKEAGEEAQRLLQDVVMANELINKIK